MSFHRVHLLLPICLLAVFGAGVADVLFTDVIPIRPYTVFFQALIDIQESLAFEQAHVSLASLLIIGIVLISLGLFIAGVSIPIFPLTHGVKHRLPQTLYQSESEQDLRYRIYTRGRYYKNSGTTTHIIDFRYDAKPERTR